MDHLQPNFVSILNFFNQHLRNNSGQNFFFQIWPSDMIYEGVAPVHITRLVSTISNSWSRWRDSVVTPSRDSAYGATVL
jgi:hypothetical protein